jgi:hypothetical protein
MSIPFFSQLEKWLLDRDEQNAAGALSANLHQNLNLDEGQLPGGHLAPKMASSMLRERLTWSNKNKIVSAELLKEACPTNLVNVLT